MSAPRLLLFAAACALACGGCAVSQPAAVGAHLASRHFGQSDGDERCEVNPGLYYRSASGLTAGAYRNSLCRASAYAGITVDAPLTRGAVQLTAGGVTGYFGGVDPMVVASAVVPGTGLRIVAAPKTPKTRATVHFAWEYRLGSKP